MNKIIFSCFLICSICFGEDSISENNFNGIPIMYGGPAKPCIPICIDEPNQVYSNNQFTFIIDTNGYLKVENFGHYENTKDSSNTNWFISVGPDTVILNTNWVNSYYQEQFTNPISPSLTTNWTINDFCSTNYFVLNHAEKYTTWYYKNYKGDVKVNFEVYGYGISQTTKQALEEEIYEAIQKILDLHFPEN